MTGMFAGFQGWLESDGKSRNTVRSYVQDLNVFKGWYEEVNGEAFVVDKLTNWDVKKYRQWSLDTKQVKPATWNHRRTSLAVLADYAKEMGVLEMDVMRGVKTQETVTAIRWLDEGDYNRLMRQLEVGVNASKTPMKRMVAVRDRAMVTLMCQAGVRVAELCALDVKDVQIGIRKGEILVRKGKGDKPRTLPLAADVRDALKDWLKVRGSEAGALFCNRNGGRIVERDVQRRVEEIGKMARIERSISPHDLRHTCGKRMAKMGVRLETIAKLFGHKSIQTTMRYVEPGWEDLEKAVEMI